MASPLNGAVSGRTLRRGLGDAGQFSGTPKYLSLVTVQLTGERTGKAEVMLASSRVRQGSFPR